MTRSWPWLRQLFALWLWSIVVFFASTAFAYDFQQRANVVYDGATEPVTSYDGAVVLSIKESGNGTDGAHTFFTKFAEFLAAETAQSTQLLDTTLDPLPMGQDVLNDVVATDPALQNVRLSVVPTYTPYLGENVLGQATRDTAIDMQNEISSLAFQNRSSLVGTIIHEEMHLRIFQGAAEGNASYINLLQSGADEAYVQSVEARFATGSRTRKYGEAIPK